MSTQQKNISEQIESIINKEVQRLLAVEKREVMGEFRQKEKEIREGYKAELKKMEEEGYEYMISVIEKVHTLYGISRLKLRVDLARDDDTKCRGIKKNGKYCTNKATKDGYCCFHVNDLRPSTPICLPVGVLLHNHPFPSPLRSDCEACDAMKKNEVRDLGSIM
tara:strand:- start:3198 stop:3689 length:492 start_codon:yes stop_codon:yes gene_type:complete